MNIITDITKLTELPNTLIEGKSKNTFRAWQYNNDKYETIDLIATRCDNILSCFDKQIKIKEYDMSDVGIKTGIVIVSNRIAIYSRWSTGNTLVINNNVLEKLYVKPETCAFLMRRRFDVVVDNSIPDDMIFVGYFDKNIATNQSIIVKKIGETIKYFHNPERTKLYWMGIKLTTDNKQ